MLELKTGVKFADKWKAIRTDRFPATGMTKFLEKFDKEFGVRLRKSNLDLAKVRNSAQFNSVLKEDMHTWWDGKMHAFTKIFRDHATGAKGWNVTEKKFLSEVLVLLGAEVTFWGGDPFTAKQEITTTHVAQILKHANYADKWKQASKDTGNEAELHATLVKFDNSYKEYDVHQVLNHMTGSNPKSDEDRFIKGFGDVLEEVKTIIRKVPPPFDFDGPDGQFVKEFCANVNHELTFWKGRPITKGH